MNTVLEALVADLCEREVVLDLRFGASTHLPICSRRVGPNGRAAGIDTTEEMLDLAPNNAREAGIEKRRVLRTYLEGLPLPDQGVDVVISNCVINLSGDEPKSSSKRQV